MWKINFVTASGYTWTRGNQVSERHKVCSMFGFLSNKNIIVWCCLIKCRSENCLDRCTFYTRRSKSIRYTGLKHSVSYGDACVDTKVWQDTVNFSNVHIPHSYFGVANRMNGFDHGFGKWCSWQIKCMYLTPYNLDIQWFRCRWIFRSRSCCRLWRRKVPHNRSVQ